MTADCSAGIRGAFRKEITVRLWDMDVCVDVSYNINPQDAPPYRYCEVVGATIVSWDPILRQHRDRRLTLLHEFSLRMGYDAFYSDVISKLMDGL